MLQFLRRRRWRRRGGKGSPGGGGGDAPSPSHPAGTDAAQDDDSETDVVAQDATALDPSPPPSPDEREEPGSDDGDEVQDEQQQQQGQREQQKEEAGREKRIGRDGKAAAAAAASKRDQEERRRIKVILGVYTTLLVLGFGLSLLSDLARLMPRLLELSLALQIVSTLFFCIVVPLTHFSGTFFFPKWRFFQPFRGGLRFILFQALSWTFYALCLVLAVCSLLFWSSLAKLSFGAITSFGALGVLSQVFMVSSFFVYERQKHRTKGKAKAVAKGQQPQQQPQQGAGQRLTERAQGLVRLVSAMYKEVFFHHNLALAVVAVALAILAETLWCSKDLAHHRDFARGAGALSVVLFTTVLFNTYGIGGHLHNGASKQWRFWQPFFGGAKFVLLQALSWTFFTLSVAVELAFVVSTFALGFELFVGAAVVAGVFFLVSEVLMICSLHVYIPATEAAAPAAELLLAPEKLKLEGARPPARRGKAGVVSLIRMSVDEEALDQFRRLTVITVLSNMQYLPFLLPIMPFLACGLPLADATRHWFAFFCCLTLAVVVNAFAKQTVAKAGRPMGGLRRRLLLHGLPLLVYGLPGAFTLGSFRAGSRAWPAWLALTAVHYAYMLLTFRGCPEVTGERYLGEGLELWPGVSLYGLLDGIERYFHAKLLWTAPLDMSKPHLLAFHPHGVQPFTVFWIQLSRAWRERMPGQRFCVMTASVTHFVPLMRDILQWLGGREVSRESILRALDQNQSVLLVPGGQREMLESQSCMDETRIVTTHVGFIRIALQKGVPLVPVLSLGEVEVMDFVRIPKLQRFFIQRIGIPVPFFPYGLFGFPIPRPVPVTVVFGRPIHVEQVAHPTPEQVEAVAKRYFASIREVFELHKHQALGPEAADAHRLVLL